MQAVLLLAGQNKRLWPLNKGMYKALLEIHGKALVEYIIDDLISCGIRSIIIVINSRETDIREYIQSKKNPEAKIQFAFQEKPLGQGNALLQAKQFITDESFIVPNPYHINERDLFRKVIQKFAENNDLDGLIPAIYEEQINEYGSMILSENRILGIVEKPEKGKEPSKYRATSLFIFKKDFLDILEKEKEDQYSYEAAITKYAQDHTVEMFEIDHDHYIPTLKYPWHMLELRDHISQKINGSISPKARIAPTALIEDTVVVDDGAVIHEGAHLKGHTYVGRNAIVGDYAVIRDSDIGETCQVGAYSEITRSIIMAGTHSHGGGFIGDSVIGKHCRLGFGFSTANKRTDRKEIATFNRNGEKKNTFLTRMGAVLGHEVKTGSRVTTMPGILIGGGSHIWPGVIAHKNVPEMTRLVFKQNLSEETLSTLS
ncbi:hypothetical protein A3D06_02390 [Candidatus Roizmanbacteria bacterium RIFCSPHIGHO2_02_FULL_40_9]|uniref:Nucleotidyl transferase domain-containing protein n=1 Tax=Candidatus Roizmanbacteria bacterium RIFCSPHIGHO2_02_FULL_40_9 TaxID=1802042 RepID=A0A1F7HC68_9BACT|nr:MAG: hypothetical protein A3D06_02390 [Candidatus Roizmanbacteria bacterium RIFCSPHIGHO2_02_FULL_40_9]